jgi:hypothetical protein
MTNRTGAHLPSSWAAGTPGRRRFRSEYVVFGALGAVVLACGGYGLYHATDRTCVDPATQRVIDSSNCRSGGPGAWYYGGRSSGIGSKATGGSYERSGFGGRTGGGS